MAAVIILAATVCCLILALMRGTPRLAALVGLGFLDLADILILMVAVMATAWLVAKVWARLKRGRRRRAGQRVTLPNGSDIGEVIKAEPVRERRRERQLS